MNLQKNQLITVLDTSAKMTTRLANKLHKFQTGEKIMLLILLNFHKILKKSLKT